MERGFRITRGKGFHITFENGWTVSVQFGFGNYCKNRDIPIEQEKEEAEEGCPNAEVWAWRNDKESYEEKYPENPEGYQTPEEVANFIQKIRHKK